MDGRRKLKRALGTQAEEYYRESVPAEAKLSAGRIRYGKSGAPFFRRLGRYAAMVVLSLVLTMSAVISIQASGGPTPELRWNQSNGYITVRYDEDAAKRSPREFAPVYSVGYVPTGYVLTREVVSDGYYTRTYMNVLGYVIELEQQEFDTSYIFEAGNLTVQEIYRDDRLILLCREERRTVCVWNSEEYTFMLTVYGPMEERIIDRIVASLDEADEGYNQ